MGHSQIRAVMGRGGGVQGEEGGTKGEIRRKGGGAQQKIKHTGERRLKEGWKKVKGMGEEGARRGLYARENGTICLFHVFS